MYHNKLKQKIISLDNLYRQVNLWRFRGNKIVFTNGCFDILHLGHVEYLAKAKDLGNILIVGLNTDASVKKQNKSPERPVNNEEARGAVLAGLECVDGVVLFNDETPYELIKKIQPDVLVKGGDYKAEEIVGYDIVKACGGQTLTIPLTEGFSTTSLIKKLKS